MSATQPIRAPARPAAPPPPIGRIVLGVVLVLLGIAWLVDTAGIADVRWSTILPAVLLVIGLALVAAARWGASSGLVTAGVLLSILVIASSLLTVPLAGQLTAVGDVDQRPGSAEQLGEGYGLGVGSMEVDLGAVDEPATASLGVGIGELVVRVPQGSTVEIDARAGVGEVVVDGRSRGGVGIRVRERLDGGPTVLTIDLSVGIGKVEVRR